MVNFAVSFLVVVLACSTGINAQFGVKTQQRINSTGLYPNLPSGSNNNNRTDCSFGFGCIGVGSQFNQQKFNATGEFLNRTKTEQPTGICFKEVPTVSLLTNQGFIPSGNGSDPTLSRIQVCCEGYERNPHNFYKCDPICENECINGLCFSPNVCKCYPEHTTNLAGFCTATCPIGCGNGECLPDNSCACKKGYYLEPNTMKFCIPTCSQGCSNGNCTAPEECTCNDGYRLSVDNKCVPKCSDGCANGDCVAPEQCSCHPGYMKTDGVCTPICTRGCDGGVCIRPDICECKPGFTTGPTGTKCIPNCEPSCLNGECIGSNKCACRSGYILDEYAPNRCLPHCPKGCPNGTCSGPNFCICNPGFVKDRSIKGGQVCVPRA